jgi:hypothetical protein
MGNSGRDRGTDSCAIAASQEQAGGGRGRGGERGRGRGGGSRVGSKDSGWGNYSGVSREASSGASGGVNRGVDSRVGSQEMRELHKCPLQSTRNSSAQ